MGRHSGRAVCLYSHIWSVTLLFLHHAVLVLGGSRELQPTDLL